jgi:hypothetical protein
MDALSFSHAQYLPSQRSAYRAEEASSVVQHNQVNFFAIRRRFDVEGHHQALIQHLLKGGCIEGMLYFDGACPA